MSVSSCTRGMEAPYNSDDDEYEEGKTEEISVQDMRELLENLRESVDRYYEWASLLQEEFREIKRRMKAIEASLAHPGNDRGDAHDVEGQLVRRLERLRNPHNL